MKKALAQHGFAEHLANVVSSLQNEKDEYLQQRVQSSADFIVMLLIEGYKIVCILNLFYLPSVSLPLPGLQMITLSFRKDNMYLKQNLPMNSFSQTNRTSC